MLPHEFTPSHTQRQPQVDWSSRTPPNAFHNMPDTTQYRSTGPYGKMPPEREGQYFMENREEEDKADPDLMAKFESLALDEQDQNEDEHPAQLYYDYDVTPSKVRSEPKRHASEAQIGFEYEWKKNAIRPPPGLNVDRHSGPSVKTNVSSSLSVTSLPLPPSQPLPPPRANVYMHPPYSSYSSNCLPMVSAGIQLYPMPGFYICQPTVVPVAMPYGCYTGYPQMTYKPEPRRYLSSKQQPFHGPVQTPPQIPMPSSDSPDVVISIIKDYELTGEYKKLTGQIVELARLQSGSRFLQKEIDKGNNAFISFVLHEVIIWPRNILGR